MTSLYRFFIIIILFFSFCSSFTKQQLFLLASCEWRIIYVLFSLLCSVLDSSCCHLILIASYEHCLLSNKYLLPLLESFLFPSGILKNTAANPVVLTALLYNCSLVQNTNSIQFVCFWGHKKAHALCNFLPFQSRFCLLVQLSQYFETRNLNYGSGSEVCLLFPFNLCLISLLSLKMQLFSK